MNSIPSVSLHNYIITSFLEDGLGHQDGHSGSQADCGVRGHKGFTKNRSIAEHLGGEEAARVK